MRHLLLAVLSCAVAGPAFAADGKTAWISSNHIQVVDLDTATVVGRIPLQEFIHDMEFSPDGSVAYVASSGGLRVADADKLEFTQRVSEAPSRGVVVSADGKHVAAIHKAAPADALAARKAGLPLPPSMVAVYDAASMTQESSFPVSGNTFDLAIAPDGLTLYALNPHEGTVESFGLTGVAGPTVRIVEQDMVGPHQAMLSELALSPDGTRLVVAVTNADDSWLAEVDLAGKRAAEQQVLSQSLGHSRRIQGVRWDDDGSGVFVTAINSLVKYNEAGLPVQWQGYPVNYVDIQGLPGQDLTVAVTPTFSKARGSGGLAVLDKKGEVVRSVELPDMSPFVVAVRP